MKFADIETSRWTTGRVTFVNHVQVEDETHFVLYRLYYGELPKSTLNEVFAQSAEMFRVLMMTEQSASLILMLITWLVLYLIVFI